jgi:hypothetical protein
MLVFFFPSAFGANSEALTRRGMQSITFWMREKSDCQVNILPEVRYQISDIRYQISGIRKSGVIRAMAEANIDDWWWGVRRPLADFYLCHMVLSGRGRRQAALVQKRRGGGRRWETRWYIDSLGDRLRISSLILAPMYR